MSPDLRHFWSPRKRKLLLWLGGLVLAYALVGFLVLPPVVRSVAVKQLSRQLGREVSIRQVRINPFVLSVTVRGLLIKDVDGAPFASWDEVYVNFQLASFLGRAWVFKEISATKPYLRLQMNKDGTFNFSDILARFAAQAPAPARAAPPKPVALRVDRLHLGGVAVALADFTPRQSFQRLVGPLDIALDNFRTDPDNKNPYSFIGTTDAGETISWSGFFYLTPLRSEGELKLFNFALKQYAPLYQDLVRFEVRGGTIALDTKYRLAFSATNRVAAVDDLKYELRDFKLGEPGDSNNLIEVPLFSALDASADLQKRTATVGSVQLTGVKALLQRDTNIKVNFVEIARPAASATNAPGSILFLLRSVTNAVALLLNTTNQWSGTVGSLAATNCELHLVDLANPRPARLDLSDIRLEAKNLSNLPGTNLEADLALRWNTNGAIHIGASVGFDPATADVAVDLDRLDLTTLDAYLADKLDLYVLGSEVNLHGTVRLRPQVNHLPVVSFNGDASLEHFHTVDGLSGDDLVKWDALRFNHIAANLNPPLVAVGDMVVDGVRARLIVETNYTLNLVNVLKPAGTETPAGKALTGTVAVAPAPAANPPVQISIRAILITNTAIQFTDRSLEPNVSLALESVNGTIAGISSEQLEHAVVNLNALAEGAGSATITGIINPLNGGLTNVFTISVKDLDLTPASPYAGKFVGYGIAEGKLNLDLSYLIAGTNLASKNVITLDHLTLGEKVDSPEATHRLAVRLAVAILKDREGKIVLNVPVAGSLNDPEFHFGQVVDRALLNILEKAATAPFSLLSAVLGGGEELGWQDFAAGSAKLTFDNRKKLYEVAKALYARPALKLEIAGSVDPDSDRDGLQRAALDQAIRVRIWKKLRRSEQAQTPVAQIDVSKDRARQIQEMLAEAFAARKLTPEMIATNRSLAASAAQLSAQAPMIRKGAQLLTRHTAGGKAAPAASARLAPQRTSPLDPNEVLLLATFPVSDSDLAVLAVNRARAVAAELLENGKVSPSRLFVVAAGPATLRRDGSRTYLQFR